MKEEKWEEFQDRRGDSGRAAALYVAQGRSGMRLRELAVAAGMKDYSAVSITSRRFELRLRGSKRDRELLKEVCGMSNVEI